jgi:hypothetical protein
MIAERGSDLRARRIADGLLVARILRAVWLAIGDARTPKFVSPHFQTWRR